MAPDLRRKVDAARAARLVREAEMKKQADAQVSLGSFVQLCIKKSSVLLFWSIFYVFFDLVEMIKPIHWFRSLLFIKTSGIPHTLLFLAWLYRLCCFFLFFLCVLFYPQGDVILRSSRWFLFINRPCLTQIERRRDPSGPIHVQNKPLSDASCP